MSMFLTCQVKRTSILESLPNIVGGFSENYHDQGTLMQASGCFKIKQTRAASVAATERQTTPNGRDFDASLSSSIYQDNAPVKPLSITTAFLIRY